MKINHSIQIYRTYDYELMVLYEAGLLDITTEAKNCLLACYNMESYVIKIPSPSRPVENVPARKHFRIEIDDEEAPGIVDWFYGITSGFRNTFIKTLLKRALAPEWENCYWQESDIFNCENGSVETVKRKKHKRKDANKVATQKATSEKDKDGHITDKNTFEQKNTAAYNEDTSNDEEDLFDMMLNLHKNSGEES